MPQRIPYTFGKRDLKCEEHWKPLKLNNFKITKPTIVCLGGNGVIDAELANGFCKRAETFVGLKIGDASMYSTYRNIDLIGFSYGRDSVAQTAGAFNDEEINKIVDNIFMPLFLDNKGKLLPKEICAKNMSLVTFFSHCHGAKEVNNFINNIDSKLLMKGSTKEDNQFIFSQSFSFSYSPLTDETWLPTVRVDSLQDSFNYGLGEIYRNSYYQTLNGVAIKHDGPGQFRRNPAWMVRNETISIYSSQLLNQLGVHKDEHSIKFLERDEKWSIGANAQNAKNADAVSQMAGYAVAMAVVNSLDNSRSDDLVPKMSFNELKNELQDILDGYKADELQK